MIPWCIMQPSIAHTSKQQDLRCSMQIYHHQQYCTPQIIITIARSTESFIYLDSGNDKSTANMLTDAKAPAYVGDSTRTLSPGFTSISKLWHTDNYVHETISWNYLIKDAAISLSFNTTNQFNSCRLCCSPSRSNIWYAVVGENDVMVNISGVTVIIYWSGMMDHEKNSSSSRLVY